MFAASYEDTVLDKFKYEAPLRGVELLCKHFNEHERHNAVYFTSFELCHVVIFDRKKVYLFFSVLDSGAGTGIALKLLRDARFGFVEWADFSSKSTRVLSQYSLFLVSFFFALLSAKCLSSANYAVATMIHTILLHWANRSHWRANATMRFIQWERFQSAARLLV